MTANDAIRFLAHEAQRCRDRDSHEALCLWLPALCKVLGVRPCDDFEALAIQERAHRELRALNESPLVQCQCETCATWEALPRVKFNGCPSVAFWCAACGGERSFVRREGVRA